jgi:hypothetical protein
MTHEIYLYPGSSSFSNGLSNHVIIAPQYNCTEDDIRFLASRTIRAIKTLFKEAAW